MTMIERVARAIDPHVWKSAEIAKDFLSSAGCSWEGSYEQGVHKKKMEASLDRAKAAIEAMREPTPSMTDAARHIAIRMRLPIGSDYWKGMINAALQEKSDAL